MNRAGRRFVMGLFKDEKGAVSAIKALEGSPFEISRVHSPFPSHKILDALRLKKSRVGWVTLCGGIAGFVAGIGLAVFTASRWKLIVGGHPILAWVPFLIIGFEFTILFSVVSNIFAMLYFGRIPEFETLGRYDTRCSGSHFGVVASCSRGEENEVIRLMEDSGGEAGLLKETGSRPAGGG